MSNLMTWYLYMLLNDDHTVCPSSHIITDSLFLVMGTSKIQSRQLSNKQCGHCSLWSLYCASHPQDLLWFCKKFLQSFFIYFEREHGRDGERESQAGSELPAHSLMWGSNSRTERSERSELKSRVGRLTHWASQATPAPRTCYVLCSQSWGQFLFIYLSIYLFIYLF